METQAVHKSEAGPEGRSRVLRGSHVVMLCVVVVLVLYVRAAWSYGKSLTPQPNPAPIAYNFQNQISNSLLDGKLSLEIDPPEALLRLHDPYDPIANSQYRQQGLHDLSLYKGRLYAYFGPTPAILLYIPFRILRVGALSPTLATLIFCALGFLFSLALFRLLVRWCYREIPVWMHCVAVITLGLGLPAAWMVYIGRDYEATIACAYTLLFAGAYFLARGILVGSSRRFLAVGSVALGLAVAARPTMIVTSVFVLVAALLVLRAGFDDARRNSFLAALITPYVVIGLLIALYNYARFDSVIEFGQSYQLAGFNPRTYQYGSLSYLPRGLYYYLFSPGRVMDDYPYLFLRESTLDIPRLLQNHGYQNEPVAGLFTNMPVAMVGFSLLATRIRRAARLFPKTLVTLAGLLAPAAGAVLLISYQFRGATMRYELDFVPLIVFGSLFAWVAWNKSPSPASWPSRVGNTLFLAALAATIAFNLAITLTPCAGTGSC
jgi:hypothetical protein